LESKKVEHKSAGHLERSFINCVDVPPRRAGRPVVVVVDELVQKSVPVKKSMELFIQKIVGEEEEKGGGGTVNGKSKIRIGGREEAQQETLLRPDFECNQTGLANELCLDELIHCYEERVFCAEATLGRVFGNLGGGVAKGDDPN